MYEFSQIYSIQYSGYESWLGWEKENVDNWNGERGKIWSEICTGYVIHPLKLHVFLFFLSNDIITSFRLLEFSFFSFLGFYFIVIIFLIPGAD